MQNLDLLSRPHTTVILAMSADGKIADVRRSPARFSSSADRFHLEKQVSLADAVLFGAATLRAYGTTLSVSNPQLKTARLQQGKPAQPIQIVCSASAQFESNLRFFRQSVPRWLLTTGVGAQRWESNFGSFERILVADLACDQLDWRDAFAQLTNLGIQRLAILGGGKLVASLLDADLIDEFWLTICPLILGGQSAPTPVEGKGFLFNCARSLKLLSVETIDQEIFLHYRLQEN